MPETRIELSWAGDAPEDAPELVSGADALAVSGQGGRGVLNGAGQPVVLRMRAPQSLSLLRARGRILPGPWEMPAPLVIALRPDERAPGADSLALLPDGSLRKLRAITGNLPCFAPGTRIATPYGARPVESLQAGDLVLTRDNGLRPVIWQGSTDFDPRRFGRLRGLSPVVILPGALGEGQPAHPLTVSPNHKVLLADDAASIHFGEREVLLCACELVAMGRAHTEARRAMRWCHLLLARHEVILSEGAWTETLQPLQGALAGFSAVARAEVEALVPEAVRGGVGSYASARTLLTGAETRLLSSFLPPG